MKIPAGLTNGSLPRLIVDNTNGQFRLEMTTLASIATTSWTAGQGNKISA